MTVRPALAWPVTPLTPSGLQPQVPADLDLFSTALFQVLHDDSFASTPLGGGGQTCECSLWVVCYNCMCTHIISPQTCKSHLFWTSN